MLTTAVDLLFVVAGLAVVIAALRARPAVPPPGASPEASLSEVVLTGVALLCAAIGPNILVIALTPGMPGMPALARWLLIPSLATLLGVAGLAERQGQSRLVNRIRAGIWVGAAATAALDAVRLTGFSLGLMPGNMPRMFGVLLLDRMAEGPTGLSDLIGYLYHYWVGACFGLTYTLICGRTPWWGALLWGLIIELGMMITPPMVVAMDTGYFGLKYGYGLLGVSLTAHVVFGAAMGVLFERYVDHRGSIFSILRGAWAHAPAGRPIAAGRRA
jgi:hypothetical protein